MSTWRSIHIFHSSSCKESDIWSLSLEPLLYLLPSTGIHTDTPKQLACRQGRYIWRFCPCPSVSLWCSISLNTSVWFSFSGWVSKPDENTNEPKDRLRSTKTCRKPERNFPSKVWFPAFHCGIDAATRQAGQTADRFFLFLSFSQFNYHSSQTHIALDWHSVWDSRSVLRLFISVPQRLISSTNDLAGSSQMMEITELSLPKLRGKKKKISSRNHSHLIVSSFPLFFLIYIAPFWYL